MFRHKWRGTFSCLPKRKYPKRRAPGALIGWRRYLAFLANPGARATRRIMRSACRPHNPCLKQGARLFPDWLRYSVSAAGLRAKTPTPLAQPSIAGILRASEPPCRAGFASRRRSKSCEFGERSKYREAQGTRAAGKPSGRVSFGYFSLAEQRKVPRPSGRNPDTR
jgi:hypothetical protein